MLLFSNLYVYECVKEVIKYNSNKERTPTQASK